MEILASLREIFGHVSVKAAINGSGKDLNKLGHREKQLYMYKTLMTCRPLTFFEGPTAEPEFVTETFCGPVDSE